ncbi:hypothetical protein Efla_000408 [Eimeria flavescens]
MQLSPESASRVPAGFARPLSVSEVPLMAQSDHNKHPAAPKKAKQVYTMLLPTPAAAAAAPPRGYHALRFLKQRHLSGKQLWQRYTLLVSLALLGVLLLLWEQLTLPLLLHVQQLRYPLAAGAAAVEEDVRRCGELKERPRAYAQGLFVPIDANGRRELLLEAAESERELKPALVAALLGPGSSSKSSSSSGGEPLRLLSRQQHEGVFGFFEGLVTAFKLKGVRWALAGPSLVGSLERHDLLPREASISIVVNSQDKQKVRDACNFYNPLNELLKTRAYVPQTLFSWIAATNSKPKFEEQAFNAPYGLISVDTSKASDGLSFPPLSVKVYWFKVVPEAAAPADAAGGGEGFVEMGGGPSKFTVPLAEWAPFVERPFGLLAVPTPRNPLFYLNRFYKSANPSCAAALQGDAAAAADAAGSKPGSSSRSSRWFSSLPFWPSSPVFRCSSYTARLASSALPFVRRTQVTRDCLKEEFFSGGQMQLEVFSKSRYSPAPEYASWLPHN